MSVLDALGDPAAQKKTKSSLAYTCSVALDFTRLLSRICSVVNSPPQTLQRQPGDAASGITGTPC